MGIFTLKCCQVHIYLRLLDTAKDSLGFERGAISPNVVRVRVPDEL